MTPLRRTPTRPGDPAGLADPTTLSAGDVMLELESEGRIVARARAWLAIAAADVAVHEVREGGVVGVYAAPAGIARRPAVIVLGGSEGGLFTARSMALVLASQGYAVLGLGYFRGGEPELATLPPTLEEIPLEVLEAGRRWLLAQPGVAPDRLALVGVSKGAELALLGAATYAWVDAVAAFAPSHVVWEGIPATPSTRGFRSSWTLAGRPLPFVPWSLPAEQRGDRIRQLTGNSRLTEAHLESLAEARDSVAAATIPVERSRAAMLLLAGIDDAMWPWAHAAAQIEARLAKANPPRSPQVEYLATGHQVLGTGWAPTTAFQHGAGRLQGGNAALDAAAQAQGWTRLLAFLSRHLGPAS